MIDVSDILILFHLKLMTLMVMRYIHTKYLTHFFIRTVYRKRIQYAIKEDTF